MTRRRKPPATRQVRRLSVVAAGGTLKGRKRPMRTNLSRVVTLVAVMVWFVAAPATAQYFGRNKVQYKDFNFQVLKTEHFDIYFYPQEPAWTSAHDWRSAGTRVYRGFSSTSCAAISRSSSMPRILAGWDAGWRVERWRDVSGESGRICRGPVRFCATAATAWQGLDLSVQPDPRILTTDDA
jgi:hypothetical protein